MTTERVAIARRRRPGRGAECGAVAARCSVGCYLRSYVAPPVGHYFDDEPVDDDRISEVDLVLPDLTLRMTTGRQMFSPRRVDPGTRLLLLEAGTPPATGTIADVGCGYGPIALTLARRAPETEVWAVDVNRRALDFCRANASAAGLANVVVRHPADVPHDLRVEGFWSNPPIRIGKPALRSLVGDWMRRLRPDGEAWLVVGRHLGSDSLLRWLDSQGWPTERQLSRQGYRILRSRRGCEVDGEPT